MELLTHKAPCSISSLALFCSVSKDLVSQCKDSTIQARQVLVADLLFELPLIKLLVLDHTKCSSSSLIARTKGALNPDKGKDPKKFLKNCWNTYRPFVKCQCKRINPNSSCKASIFWFDHILWFIFQNLNKFFPFSSNYFSL